ncbi:benzoate/H(+) symporter BenE family transporter [Aestuariirhabdus sp. LZHN29]|uniref:benzoate/H(+) symporter BenE family transporter n=1 Tax=Aestuariirhabdus sp. LZHN29 TaxID=3417462 RepID=UPI003CEB0968
MELRTHSVKAGSAATSISTVQDQNTALLTCVITASGLSLMGIGSAFWGLVIGI